MKQSSFAPQNVIRTMALAAGVVGVALVGAAPSAQASGIPLPHEVIRDVHEIARSHVRHVTQIVDHVVVRHDGYRRYPGHVRYPRYYRPAYRYPVVARGYRPYRPYDGRVYVSAYVGVPQVGVVVAGRPGRDVYRDDDCDRNDDRGRYGYEDDRRQYDNEDDD